MKQKFSTIDIMVMVNELQKYVGMRVNQVYDIDNKTYLLKLNRYEEKITLLFESGVRIHTTEFDWPKNPSPSGFSMKMRKHLKNKRLEKLTQVGTDRILDLQFGINDAAYHVILELYDRGNIVLTDYEYLILNILRPRKDDSEDVKFLVRENYPIEKMSNDKKASNRDEICAALNSAKEGDSIKRVIMPHVMYGSALLDHVLLKNDFSKNCCIGKQVKIPADIHRLFLCLDDADRIMDDIVKNPCGFIIHKVETNKQNLTSEIVTNIEFHPFLFSQYETMKYTKYPTFDRAVDNYFSSMEGQKIDVKAFQKEKEALKKLENVKKDHEQRLSKLHESQFEDIRKAELIEMNLELVEKAILVIRSAIANQISWSDIQDLIKEAQIQGDPVAKAIKKLKLDMNHFSILLGDVHIDSKDDKDSKPQLVDIDLDCSAYANARRYYNLKRAHAMKEQKTLESSEKAFKNAEKKTRQALKEVAVTTSITKARKVIWFEKFLWFISSENYLVIAGRDIAQNELLVKKYLKQGDLYVHADIHGASSLVIKNPSGSEVPPKTLNEAATMAVCYSAAWDAKIMTSAWWVYNNQVSKTAPSGEYLTTGSFMIRGKKNFLQPSHLIMGFGFMFKLDDECMENHINERCVRSDETLSLMSEDLNQVEEPENADGNSNSLSEDSSADEENETEVPAQNMKSDEENETEVYEQNMKSDDENADIDVDVPSISNIDFPDTEVKLDVLTERELEKAEIKSILKGSQNQVIIQQSRSKNIAGNNVPQNISANSTVKEKQKRGQKGKLKKIKEKYQYQDEEERELRMKILGSAGKPKEEKKKGKNKKGKEFKLPNIRLKNTQKSIHFIEDESPIVEGVTVVEENPSKNPKDINDESNQNPEEDDNEELDDIQTTEEIKLMNSLTGIPVSEDTLLFAVPVCAPYTTMLNYKYKVKIIPGSSKRGKAGKTALQIFLHEKSGTPREKDLLRSVKDQDISRNLPGKVKISTANFKKVK